MTQQGVTTCLMFVGDQHGRAAEAIETYTTLVKNSNVEQMDRYGPGEEEPEGTLRRGVFSLDGQQFVALDSAREHPFGFTPAISLIIECDSEAEIDELYARLSEGGSALMPLGDYGLSAKFGWVQDRFGVTWQLNFA